MATMAYEFIETPEVNTNLWSSTPIMIVPGCTYHMSFDIKRDPSDTDTHPCYISLNPLDDNKNFINSNRVLLIAKTETTLAEPLSAGQTTVTLTSATNWVADTTYRCFGACTTSYGMYKTDNPRTIKKNGISGNVITLSSAYSGPTLPAGTPVREFTDGATFYYPFYWQNSNPNWQSNDWWHVEFDFNFGSTTPGNRNYSAKYFTKGMLMYKHKYEMKNIVLYNKSIEQDAKTDIIVPKVYKNGIMEGKFEEYYQNQEHIGNYKIESPNFIEI